LKIDVQPVDVCGHAQRGDQLGECSLIDDVSWMPFMGPACQGSCELAARVPPGCGFTKFMSIHWLPVAESTIGLIVRFSMPALMF
jgi:hypothetical protein